MGDKVKKSAQKVEVEPQPMAVEIAVAVSMVQTLTYEIPPELLMGCSAAHGPDNLLGKRVLVPLGRRKVTGYVLALSLQDHDFTIKPILRFLDDYAIFKPELIPFFRWISNYYHYPIGLVIKAAVPAGLVSTSRKYLSTSKSFDDFCEILGKEIPAWLQQLSEKGFLSPAKTFELLSDTSTRKTLQSLISSGQIDHREKLVEDRVREKKEQCFTLSKEIHYQCLAIFQAYPQGIKVEGDSLGKIRDSLRPILGHRPLVSSTRALLGLCQLIEENHSTTIAAKELRSRYANATKALQPLVAAGYVKLERRKIERGLYGNTLKGYGRPGKLTAEQQGPVASLKRQISKGGYASFLLHGVTGSGKTEVYLRAIEACLQAGKDAIILVPEIALASQFLAHLTSRFSEKTAQLHSGLTAAQRYDQYLLALSGKARIAIGARSAVFAPVTNLGLIIVDEEHDGSYKQDEAFAYNAHDLAVVRGKHQQCTVILGSATPSLNSYSNAKKGKYTLLSMPSRVGSSSLPEVIVKDLTKRDSLVAKTLFTRELLTKIKNNLKAQKQTILLLNKRGFARALLCLDCGTPVQCNHCNVSLTLHKNKNRLVCHYCGLTKPTELVCVNCRSARLAPVGFGTQRVEDDLARLIEDARVARLDSDTTSDKAKFLRTLKRMEEREIDILVGTQMVAKGHHFPHVTLVGVLMADAGLGIPDFRAAERVFQLLTQVTGRAGRGEFAGEVVIQTLRPEHYALSLACAQDYQEFYKKEMEMRKSPAFPPYNRLVLLRIQGRVETAVKDSCRRLAASCREQIRDLRLQVEVLGPAPAPLERIRGQYRYQLLWKSTSLKDLHRLAQWVLEKKSRQLGKGCSLAIDVDPETLL